MSQIEIIKIKLLNQNLQYSQLLFHKKIINPVDSEFSLEFIALINILASLFTSRIDLII